MGKITRLVFVFSLIAIFLVASMLVSCSKATPTPTQSVAPEEQKITRIAISAGSPTGVTSLQANALAGIVKKFMGVDSTVLNYPSTMRDVAVSTNEVQIGMGNLQMTYNTFMGDPAKKIEARPNLRMAIITDFGAMQYWVPVESPIKTFRDLIGKKLSVGTKAMSPVQILSAACPALGIDFEKDLNPQYLGGKESAAALVAGKIDAYVSMTTAPYPTMVETDLTRPVRLIGHTKEDVAKIVKTVPGMIPMTIQPEYYHMDVAVDTVSTIYMAMVRSEFSEDFVYNLVKYTMQNPQFAGYYYANFESFLKDTAAGTRYWTELTNSGNPIPFHKGAIKAYQELGWKIPADLMPPEAK